MYIGDDQIHTLTTDWSRVFSYVETDEAQNGWNLVPLTSLWMSDIKSDPSLTNSETNQIFQTNSSAYPAIRSTPPPW